jgi:putative ABC transport system ATP-binding protein
MSAWGADTITGHGGTLEFRDVVKHYRVGDEVVRAVDGVSLTVHSGELVALYGPSGSGKSTLLDVAAAITLPDSGSVFLDGRDLTSLSSREASGYRLRQLGFIAQDIELLPGANAVTNAALKLYGTGMRRKDAERHVAHLLEHVGLGARLGHRPSQLSLGERQRVILVRALSTDPRVILADEPTGALDSERSKEVMALIREVTTERSIATLLVTHDPEAARFADRVCTLRDGRLDVETGAAASPAVP